jgi:hypothetical protein
LVHYILSNRKEAVVVGTGSSTHTGAILHEVDMQVEASRDGEIQRVLGIEGQDAEVVARIKDLSPKLSGLHAGGTALETDTEVNAFPSLGSSGVLAGVIVKLLQGTMQGAIGRLNHIRLTVSRQCSSGGRGSGSGPGTGTWNGWNGSRSRDGGCTAGSRHRD